jgi:diketogulonate reductase-like aldo/keto reductase
LINSTQYRDRLEENIGVADIELTEDKLSMINEKLAKIKVAGSKVDRVKKDY